MSTETTSASDATGGTPALPRRGAVRRAAAWLLGTEKIQRARSTQPSFTAEQKQLISHARLCRELADRVLNAVDPLRHGSGSPLALDLHRQGIYWVLLSSQPAGTARQSFRDVWESSQRLRALALPDSEIHELERLLCADPSFVTFADLGEAEQRAALELTGPLLDRLLDAFDGPSLALRRLVLWRAARIAVLVALLAGIVGLSVTFLIPRKPNLAEGKSWSTSSVLYPCYPDKGDCGGSRTRILFHTKEEKDPWFEYDLGKLSRFSSMTIRNRSDYGPDRAVPLVVEVSTDRKAYREIAREETSFSVWKPKFPSQEARYVRLRVARTSFLHLESVEVHP